jgi:hypothetical protein
MPRSRYLVNVIGIKMAKMEVIAVLVKMAASEFLEVAEGVVEIEGKVIGAMGVMVEM